MRTDQERIKRYRQLSEPLQELFAAPASGAQMQTIFEKHTLPEAQYKAYAQTIGDVILGFNTVSSLPQLLQQNIGIDAQLAQQVASDLVEFLSPVVEQEQQHAGEKKRALNDLADTFAQKKETSTVASKTEEAERKTGAADFEQIPTLRTMHGDIDQIHGYAAQAQTTNDDEPVVRALDQDATLQRSSKPMDDSDTPSEPPATN